MQVHDEFSFLKSKKIMLTIVAKIFKIINWKKRYTGVANLIVDVGMAPKRDESH